LSEDHSGYYTTVQGPDTSYVNVIQIVLGYVTFYQINTFFINRLYYLFIIDKMPLRWDEMWAE